MVGECRNEEEVGFRWVESAAAVGQSARKEDAACHIGVGRTQLNARREASQRFGEVEQRWEALAFGAALVAVAWWKVVDEEAWSAGGAAAGAGVVRR